MGFLHERQLNWRRIWWWSWFLYYYFFITAMGQHWGSCCWFQDCWRCDHRRWKQEGY